MLTEEQKINFKGWMKRADELMDMNPRRCMGAKPDGQICGVTHGEDITKPGARRRTYAWVTVSVIDDALPLSAQNIALFCKSCLRPKKLSKAERELARFVNAQNQLNLFSPEEMRGYK